MTERRRESRYLCADIVRMTWHPPGEVDDANDEQRGDDHGTGREARTAEAVLEDIAARGICVQVEEPIPEGSRVHVYLGESDFTGHVCYCSYQEIGYFIGITFDDAARWNKCIYEPQHLTNLQELALT